MARRLTEADREAWSSYAQLVTQRPGSEAVAAPAPVIAVVPDGPKPAVRPSPPRRLAPVAVGAAPAGLDKATWTRFRTGRLGPARTLDLHGRTAQHAFHALHAFLRESHAEGLRCVEVVTGRGQGELGGVLRRELPEWLNGAELRGLILAASHPHAANTGSVRVLLRRKRLKI